ncbi:MAG TPA: hypothetical protein VFF67_03775 [Thermoplasmata archaeon]|nr:hypothetical protein [Thermoplasmata archaeon]
MRDLQDAPAVPPEDSGGDERAGYLIAGILLILAGWGGGVLLNLLLHALAPADGLVVGTVRIFSSYGPYAIAAAAFGAVAGAFGLVLMYLGAGAPEGKLIVPGVDYPGPDPTATESPSGATEASGHP